MNVKKAIATLQAGNFVLIHDSGDRENETDFVIAAEFIKPHHITQMRNDGGGLICIAVGDKIAGYLDLPFFSDILEFAGEKFKSLRHLKADDIPYDEKSSFSININHRKTFTGITDHDRALTIKKFAEFCLNNVSREKLGTEFRSPGHVPLLISSGLKNRKGHTELTTALVEMAGLTPVVAICEMMDDNTHKSLNADNAMRYAKEKDLIFLESAEVESAYKDFESSEVESA